MLHLSRLSEWLLATTEWVTACYDWVSDCLLRLSEWLLATLSTTFFFLQGILPKCCWTTYSGQCLIMTLMVITHMTISTCISHCNPTPVIPTVDLCMLIHAPMLRPRTGWILDLLPNDLIRLQTLLGIYLCEVGLVQLSWWSCRSHQWRRVCHCTRHSGTHCKMSRERVHRYRL